MLYICLLSDSFYLVTVLPYMVHKAMHAHTHTHTHTHTYTTLMMTVWLPRTIIEVF